MKAFPNDLIKLMGILLFTLNSPNFKGNSLSIPRNIYRRSCNERTSRFTDNESNVPSTMAYRPKVDCFTKSSMRMQKLNVASNNSCYNSRTTDGQEVENPPLKRKPPRKVCLFVEPSPFSYVCGYSNRYNEMLRYMAKAGDTFKIVTTADSQIPKEKLPKKKFGYQIEHTLGFQFPLYKEMILSLDLPELKGAKVLDKFNPDVIHASSP